MLLTNLYNVLALDTWVYTTRMYNKVWELIWRKRDYPILCIHLDTMCGLLALGHTKTSSTIYLEWGFPIYIKIIEPTLTVFVRYLFWLVQNGFTKKNCLFLFCSMVQQRIRVKLSTNVPEITPTQKIKWQTVHDIVIKWFESESD